MTKILLFSTEPVGATMSGPGIRSFHLAQELAREFRVTLMAPGAAGVGLRGVESLEQPRAGRDLARVAQAFDVVIARRLPLGAMRRLARSATRVVYDLYVPVLSEQLAMLDAELGHPSSVRFHEAAMLELRYALATGDAFVCASERQRDFWLGMLGSLGRLDLETYRRDPSFRSLIDVVPFGLPSEEPRAGAPALRGVIPGIGERDRILLWGGGIWNWLDPLTVIRAVAVLTERRRDVRLVFLGSEHPEVPTMTMASQAFELARSLGLVGRAVFFRGGWVPYDERGSYLLEADVGVSAHFDSLETRYAFRTRLLDYLWAGLPTITTRGDDLGDLVASRGLGRALDAGDVEGWAGAIEAMLDDEAERARIRERIDDVREVFTWSHVARPLMRLVEREGARVSPGAEALALAIEHLVLRGRTAFEIRGPVGLVASRASRLRLRR
ncbi:MAG: glycosyltransferase family 4 protein [Thermoleophilia bacterium]